MPVRYSTQQQKTGAAIGTITAVPKPSTWTTSNNPITEGNNWDLENRFPGWLECNGQTLLVSDYPILYQVIGNTYGGTPNVNFLLPDYRSKKLMGTGGVDGNIGGGISLTPNIGPGTTQADINQPGSQGGDYTISTVRQLPAGSEITPGAPAGADVFFDVGDNVLGQPIQIVTGVAYQTFGTGVTEIGGFAEPLVATGNSYIGFGTRGTSPFNSLQSSREIRINNLNLTTYSSVRIYAIAGNDNNGGERVNNQGEGLRVIWPDGTESQILPAAGDLPGGIPEFDVLYTSWTEIEVPIPIQYRTTGVTIRFRQDIDTSTTNNPPGNEQSGAITPGTHPNSFDCIGIQRIGFGGGSIGGEADDTFEIGTFRSSGFENTTAEVSPNFSGNAGWTAGTAGQGTSVRIVSAAPEHFHVWRYAQRTNSEACAGEPYYENGRVGFQNQTQGTIISYDRGGAPIRTHSHMIAWGFVPQVQTYGNGNESGNLANATIIAANGLTNENEVATSNNLGNVISKTVDVVNVMGVNINPGVITLSGSNRQKFDNALSARLEAAEEIELMSDYARVKYIIKAY